MSWEDYVNNSLVGQGNMDWAAIFGAAGQGIWAITKSTKELPIALSDSEMKSISDILSNAAGARDKALAEGLYVNNERFVVTKIEDSTLYARQGKAGIAMAMTTQAILIGHHNESMHAGNTSKDISTLADYLKPLGY